MYTARLFQAKVRLGVCNPANTDANDRGGHACPHHAITVEQLTDAITKQWPSSKLVEKKAYHRIALDKLTLGYAYVRGTRPAVEVIKPTAAASTTTSPIKTKADLTKAINAMKAVEKRAAKKAAAAAKKAS